MSLIFKVFLLAMVTFLCQGYSGLTSTSWQVSKVKRHVDSGCHILLAEKVVVKRGQFEGQAASCQLLLSWIELFVDNVSCNPYQG